jgi:hypothetical protein
LKFPSIPPKRKQRPVAGDTLPAAGLLERRGALLRRKGVEGAGVLICGYGVRDAQAIKAFLDRTLDAYVIMVGASPKSDMKIIDEIKILMFLGFSEVQTHMVLEGFPAEGGLKRPIFCTLTAQNRHWPLSGLIAHLLEEHRRWRGGN